MSPPIPEELTAGPTLEPAPERLIEDYIREHAPVLTGRKLERTCTRQDPCQVRRDQDEAIAVYSGDATVAYLQSEDAGWGLYTLDGVLLTLADYCLWCGGRLR